MQQVLSLRMQAPAVAPFEFVLTKYCSKSRCALVTSWKADLMAVLPDINCCWHIGMSVCLSEVSLLSTLCKCSSATLGHTKNLCTTASLVDIGGQALHWHPSIPADLDAREVGIIHQCMHDPSELQSLCSLRIVHDVRVG